MVKSQSGILPTEGCRRPAFDTIVMLQTFCDTRTLRGSVPTWFGSQQTDQSK